MTHGNKLLIELLQEPLLLYRIIDGKIADPSDRLKSISALPTESLALPTESLEILADVVYARKTMDGILTVKTSVKETGGIGPTNIIDIAVISKTEHKKAAILLFEKALSRSKLIRKERLRHFDEKVLPYLERLYDRSVILAASLRGSSFEEDRYATPFCDMDILLFIDKPEKISTILEELDKMQDCAEITYLPLHQFSYGNGKAGFSGTTKTLKTGNGKLKLEFDLIRLEDWLECVKKTKFRGYEIRALTTSRLVLGQDYLSTMRNKIQEAYV
jgi:hypothetical protein